MKDSPRMAPVFLQPGNKLIVVFGGGKVAYRKCCNFEGFRIRVVAAEVLPEIESVAEKVYIRNIDGDTVRKMVTGAFIAIAATSDKKVNEMICEVCRTMNVPVNSSHGGGDVLIPSVLRKKNYTVAISSEGKVPAFPPFLVEELDRMLVDTYEKMMDLMISVRPHVMEGIETQSERAKFLADAVRDAKVWELLDSGDEEGAKHYVLEKGGLS